MLRLLTTISLACWLLTAYSQPENFNYTTVDGFARTYKQPVRNPQDLGALAAAIKAKFSTEHERARAAYAWIAANITFDVDSYNKDREQPIVDAFAILTTKKTSAAGYASLYQTLCKFLMDIECEIVPGYGRYYHEFAAGKKPMKFNHTWNAIKLEEKWYLVDACWGSGFADFDEGTFTPKYDPFYFCTLPAAFQNDHYPENPQWQLSTQKIAPATFFNRPLLRHEYYELGMVGYEPLQGMLVRKKGAFVAFMFNSPLNVLTSVAVRTDTETENDMGEPKANGDKYYYTYKTRRGGEYVIRVFVENKWVMTYKILSE